MANMYDSSNIYPGSGFAQMQAAQANPFGLPQAQQQQPQAAGMGAQISPEVVQQMIALNSQGQRQQQIQRQLAMAQALRKQGAEGVQSTSPGGGRVGAPNLMGNIARVLGDVKAGQMDKAAQEDQTKLSGEREAAMRRYFEALTRGGQQQQEY